MTEKYPRIKKGKLIIRSKLPLRNYSSSVVDPISFRQLDSALATSHNVLRGQYEDILRYLLTGFSECASVGRAQVHYIGYMSKSGKRLDGIEGFARLAFILCCWLAGNRSREMNDLRNNHFDLLEIVDHGLQFGLNPASPEFWGAIGDNDPRLCQAATLVAGFVIGGERVWPELSARSRDLFLTWISDIEDVMVPDNNWHLFKILTQQFCDREKGSFSATKMGVNEFFQRFYLGGGWFQDGSDRQFVDYYNIWIHFFLSMISRLSEDETTPFLTRRALTDFVASYRFLFTSKGPPLFGRSICYRMATPLPLVLHALQTRTDLGLARRALQDVMEFFVSRGSLRNGGVTQGYFDRDIRLTDTYTGPGGCLWSLFALAVAWTIPENDEFWRAAPVAYPVEEADFEIDLPNTGLAIVGRQATGAVSIYRTYGHTSSVFAAPRRKDRILETFLRRPIRPANHEAKYPRVVPSWPPIFPIGT